MYISLTDTAYLYLRDLPEHKYRKKHIEYLSNQFITIDQGKNAKGISNYIHNFLVNPTPNIPYPTYYSLTPPYSIRPETFVDMRDPEIQLTDYELYGEPGCPTDPELLLPKFSKVGVYDPDTNGLKFRTNIRYEYTNWMLTDEPLVRHHLTLDPTLLPIIYTIVSYWHIALNKPPKSAKESASALLNAIGLGALQHKLLPAPHNPAQGVIR